jgi:hypothetical protein
MVEGVGVSAAGRRESGDGSFAVWMDRSRLGQRPLMED